MKVTIRPNWGPPTLAAIATPVEQRLLLFRFKHFKRNFENSVGAVGMRAKEIAFTCVDRRKVQFRLCSHCSYQHAAVHQVDWSPYLGCMQLMYAVAAQTK